MRAAGVPHYQPPVLEELKEAARGRGLWNLFLPHKTEWTEGLCNLDYAPLAEIIGRSHDRAEALNCSAPDTGQHGDAHPVRHPRAAGALAAAAAGGEIRSAFAMTEPPWRSSDATNIETSIGRDGDEYVINGRKWWISGAGDRAARS